MFKRVHLGGVVSSGYSTSEVTIGNAAKNHFFFSPWCSCSQKNGWNDKELQKSTEKTACQVCVCHQTTFWELRHVFFLVVSYISCGRSTYLQCWQHFHRVFSYPQILCQLTYILSNSSKSSHPNRLGSGDILIYAHLSPANFQPTCHVAKAPSKTSVFGVVFACVVLLLKVGFLRRRLWGIDFKWLQNEQTNCSNQ